MKRQVIGFVLLSTLAVAAQSEEPGMHGEPATARPASVSTPARAHIGTQFTDQVMSDVSSRVADELEVRLAREVGSEVTVRALPEQKLLVSSH